VTIEQIVARAQISQKTFFNYFQSKSQFLEEFMVDCLKGIGLWSLPESPVEECRSSLIPWSKG
jgi:AcrR family transcriptional regulator